MIRDVAIIEYVGTPYVTNMLEFFGKNGNDKSPTGNRMATKTYHVPRNLMNLRHEDEPAEAALASRGSLPAGILLTARSGERKAPTPRADEIRVGAQRRSVGYAWMPDA